MDFFLRLPPDKDFQQLPQVFQLAAPMLLLAGVRGAAVRPGFPPAWRYAAAPPPLALQHLALPRQKRALLPQLPPLIEQAGQELLELAAAGRENRPKRLAPPRSRRNVPMMWHTLRLPSVTVVLHENAGGRLTPSRTAR